MATAPLGPFSLERMVRAVELVRERLERAAAALGQANISYAVIGGNAVAAWVSRVDVAAVRNTQDVDILLRREDLEAAATVLSTVGFTRDNVFGVDMFIDGDLGRPRDAVHVLFANEKVKESDATPAPDISETIVQTGIHYLNLEALVRMKLTSYRRKDQVHIQDLIGVELIDSSWPARYPPELGRRLQELLDDPNG
jgi:hypothetical protein